MQTGEQLLLRNTVHHENGAFTLVSISRLCDDGFDTIFRPTSATVVRQRDSKLMATATLDRGLYVLEQSQESEGTCFLLQQRLPHVNRCTLLLHWILGIKGFVT